MSQPPETESDRRDAEQTTNEQTGPISKRRQKRILDRQINHKAVEIDRTMKAVIEKEAEELDIAPAALAQRFAVVAPVGERRAAMWWNGLVSERAAEWKSEYDGPKKQYLAWVTKRIKEDDQYKNMSVEEKEKYAKLAAQRRVETKETKSAAITRKKVVEGASEELESVHQALQRLNIKMGVEFALFVTRGSIQDNLQPFYVSSKKAETFLEGHMKLPSKEMLTLMDLWAVGGVGGISTQFKNKKLAYGHSVRNKLNISFCQTIEGLGHDTSDFHHIQYSNYRKIIKEYRVILRGYPLTPNGNIVRPSDFPGGIKGLIHADEHLASGAWGFEKISDVAYKEWDLKCKEAEDGDQDMPDPPYVAVPGTEFKKGPSSNVASTAEGSRGSHKRKASTEPHEEGTSKRSQAGKSGGKATVKGKKKSRKIIEETSSESSEGESDRGDSDEESDGEETDEEEVDGSGDD